ncbi:hypothetical protein [Propionispora vibrioides]|uniref:Core-binding (CB) domain-containing protein n=1 Tax=Propionispora vibrioides TaxID=112903 RepID=A0A1H8X2F4_9FIRM|nr:hypothetical protein [Propionispora vibrioides]SEP33847.1 hypothetical protein SAMN04490178_11980 [Propionispora vibrioides]
MKNVYDQVSLFYNSEPMDLVSIKREWVESFLRYKAWQGAADSELRKLWQSIQLFIIYLQYADNEDLDELTEQDYVLLIEWLSTHVKGFKMSLKNARDFFAVLIEFQQHLVSRRIMSDCTEVERAASNIAGGKKLKLTKLLPSRDLALLSDDLNTVFTDPAVQNQEMAKVIGETVEHLMIKLGTYYQQDDFNEDFDRALYLYTGPLENIPDDGKEEFWLGFWDYFLFDYHLLANDNTPLAHFYQTFSERLSNEERQILNDLQSAQFTVFYVERILNQDWVECVNLFTNERFELPFLFDYNSLKKLLFYGHIFSQGMIVINYVTSIEVSKNLRRRIREEVLRQKRVFEIQKPGVDLISFFKRHALVVRHTIDILVTLAKVNVISNSQIERIFPKAVLSREPHAGVIQRLKRIYASYGFSKHDAELIQAMWHDLCQLTDIIVRKPEVWVAVLLYSYAQINYLNNVTVESLAADMHISEASIYKNKNKLSRILELKPFDPRYLGEEGFVVSLFMP